MSGWRAKATCCRKRSITSNVGRAHGLPITKRGKPECRLQSVLDRHPVTLQPSHPPPACLAGVRPGSVVLRTTGLPCITDGLISIRAVMTPRSDCSNWRTNAIPTPSSDECASARDGPWTARLRGIPFDSRMAPQVAVLPSHRMGKFKPARGGKKKGSTAPPGGVACVVVLLAGMVLVMLFMYWVLKSANG
jgi:hypothetical protein